MKVLKPVYYDRFVCIADQCTDTCCAGWTVELDKATYNKYKKTKGEFGKKLQANIKRQRGQEDRAYGCICMVEEDRICPFLSKERLCDVYSNLGESYMSNTCKCYPRELWKFGEIYERHLYLSCPEVAKYLVMDSDGLSFEMNEENLSELDKQMCADPGRYNMKYYHFLWEVRNLCVAMTQFREIDLWKRLVFVKMAADKIQNRIQEHEYENFERLFDGMRAEITNPQTQDALERIPVVMDAKIQFVYNILRFREDTGIAGKGFQSLIDDYYQLFTNTGSPEEMYQQLLTKEEIFNAYMKPHAYILENLMVYLLYRYIPQVLSTRNIMEVLNHIAISYAVVRALLLARWSKNGEHLGETDYIEILYKFGRAIEHSNLFKFFSKTMQENHRNNLAYFTIYIR